MVISPGYGIGDIIAVTTLVWTVYKACKGAPGEFKELSRELSTLHTILRELEDEAAAPTSLLNRRGSNRKAELDNILQNLSVVVQQIEDIAKRYHSLGRDQKRAWDRVRFADEDLAGLRSKLSLHINAINLFLASLSAGSLARIEGILDDLVRDIKDEKKEPSIISTHGVSEEAAWNELERELIGDGITKQDVERHKEDIKEYLKSLFLETFLSFDADSPGTLAETLNDFGLENSYSRRSSMDPSESSSLDQMEDPELPDFSSSGASTASLDSMSFDEVPTFKEPEEVQSLRGPLSLPLAHGEDGNLASLNVPHSSGDRGPLSPKKRMFSMKEKASSSETSPAIRWAKMDDEATNKRSSPAVPARPNVVYEKTQDASANGPIPPPTLKGTTRLKRLDCIPGLTPDKRALKARHILLEKARELDQADSVKRKLKADSIHDSTNKIMIYMDGVFGVYKYYIPTKSSRTMIQSEMASVFAQMGPEFAELSFSEISSLLRFNFTIIKIKLISLCMIQIQDDVHYYHFEQFPFKKVILDRMKF